jgi:hypothetical protein
VDWNRRSLYSVIIYLNSCAGGGRTRLLVLSPGQAYSLDDAGRFRAPDDAIVDSAPVKAGSALLFYQTVVHEGEPVGAGCEKFIIRTDLMFERTVGDDDDDDDDDDAMVDAKAALHAPLLSVGMASMTAACMPSDLHGSICSRAGRWGGLAASLVPRPPDCHS